MLPCAGVAEFVSRAKLRRAAQQSACAAGGSFLVLARKEPKKPLLGLGGLRCGKCTCPCVRTLTELPSDRLAPYVPEVSAAGGNQNLAKPTRTAPCAVAAGNVPRVPTRKARR
ncbi:MAG: hypothetical protein LBO63_02025 [Oscillospiraceae bacterium]|nr:hypothetical protein [Oscillospiraceae bacterium]